jgi:hypothetical protein
MIELESLPTGECYRMYGMSATYNTKEKVIAEAEKHGEAIWIETMSTAFVKYRNDKGECAECGQLICDCVIDAEKFVFVKVEEK